MDRQRGRWQWFDRASIWFAGFLLAICGLTVLLGILAPEPPGAIHDGMHGLAWFLIIGCFYGAAAIVLPELTQRWRPSISQGLAATWVGGWSAMLLWGIGRTFVMSGLAEARDFSGGSVFVWFVFVGLPTGIWFAVRLLRADERHRYEGFIKD